MPRTTEAWEFAGGASFPGGANLPTGSVTNNSVLAGANISASKNNQRDRHRLTIAGGADVAAGTYVMGRAYRAQTVLEAYVTPDAVPAGGTKTATVDIKKSTAGGAWTTILTGTTTLNTSSVARTPVALSLSGTPTLIAGDLLQAVITVAGSGGTNVQGLLVEVVLEENGT